MIQAHRLERNHPADEADSGWLEILKENKGKRTQSEPFTPMRQKRKIPLETERRTTGVH